MRRRHKGDKIGLSPPNSHHGNDQGTQASERRDPLHRDRAQACGQEDRPSGSQDLHAPLGGAVTWAKHREVELEDPAALICVRQGAPTLAALIRWYIETFESDLRSGSEASRAHLEFLERHALGKFNALDLTAAALIDHVRRQGAPRAQDRRRS